MNRPKTEKIYSVRELIAALQDLQEEGYTTLSGSEIDTALLDRKDAPQYEGWWCECGWPNHHDEDTCARPSCGRKREMNDA